MNGFRVERRLAILRNSVSRRRNLNKEEIDMGNIIWGIISIILGLSGKFVLIGTNSSEALIAVGIGLVIWGVIQLSKTPETSNETTQQKVE